MSHLELGLGEDVERRNQDDLPDPGRSVSRQQRILRLVVWRG